MQSHSRAGSSQKWSSDTAVPNGPNEEAKWGMPKETSCKRDVKRAEVVKEHIQQDGKKFPRTVISK